MFVILKVYCADYNAQVLCMWLSNLIQGESSTDKGNLCTKLRVAEYPLIFRNELATGLEISIRLLSILNINIDLLLFLLCCKVVS